MYFGFLKRTLKKKLFVENIQILTRRKRECLVLSTLNIFLYQAFLEMNYLLIQKFKDFTLQMIDHVA